MFERILVPLDGSTRAERAIPVAARLAHASDGSVILVRVVNKPSSLWPSLSIQGQQKPTAELFEAERYIRSTAISAELEDVAAESVVRSGSTVSTILEVATDLQADLIVMCSHGYTGFTRRIMGSVAQKLTRASSVPVLVLREDGHVLGETQPGSTRPMQALVPLDGSGHAKVALEPTANLLAALVEGAQGTLHLVRVVQPATTQLEEGGILTASAKAKRYLTATVEHIHEGLVAPAIKQHNLDVTWSVTVDTYVAEALTKEVENINAQRVEDDTLADYDLIAIATHGRDGLQRWVIGSVTEQVLRDTKMPLLVVPPQEERLPARKERMQGEDVLAFEQGMPADFLSI